MRELDEPVRVSSAGGILQGVGRSSYMRGPLGAGVVAGFALLIAAVWASGASAATSLAVTGLLVLIGVAIAALGAERPRDQSNEQRERMRGTVP
jgi:hypothetical protein